MATTTNLNSLVINYLTQAQYEAATQAGTLNENQLYLTPSEVAGETDPVFSASPAAGISTSDISNWNSKSNTDEKVKLNLTSSGNEYGIILTSTAIDKSNAETQYYDPGISFYTESNNAGGISGLTLGTSTRQGGLVLYTGNNNGRVALTTTNQTTTLRTINLPDKDGTIALTSDIPDNEDSITGTGVSGSIATFNGEHSITQGPALGSSTNTFLRNDGSWAVAGITKISTTATLAANGWSNNSQTITVNGITTNSDIIITSSESNYEAYTEAEIAGVSQATNSLTFTCTNVPSTDIVVNLLIFT